MIKIYIDNRSSFAIDNKILRNNIESFLHGNRIKNAELSVAFVGEDKVKEISKKYLKDNKPHNVLSFPAAESKEKFIAPPNANDLGEIVICYPLAAKEARSEQISINDKVVELCLHGAEHLLGIHHSV